MKTTLTKVNGERVHDISENNAVEVLNHRIMQIQRTPNEDDTRFADVRSQSILSVLVGKLVFIELATGTRVMGRVKNIGPLHIEMDFGTVSIQHMAYIRILSEHQRPNNPFQ